MVFDQQLYNDLIERADAISISYSEWYAKSYEVFKNDSDIKSIDDLIKVIAFTYSWMPTIPTIHFHQVINEHLLIKRINDLRDGKTANRELLLKELVPVINNSVVGTSKLLHFIAPDYVPIIDSRVRTGWNVFFKTEIKKQLSDLNGKNKIDAYLKYWIYVDKWRKKLDNVSYRDIELLFYTIGENE
ncbi:MAG: hypothetical protein RJQ09_16870 [Cyclobacteriaceae bacterium]